MTVEWKKAHAKWMKYRERVSTDANGIGGGSARLPANQAESVLGGEAPERGASPESCLPLDVTVFTDGSCLSHREVGGWAYIIADSTGSELKKRAGSSPLTTNNRMELMAVIRALEAIHTRSTIRVVTDSEYVAKGINEWLPRWRMQNMRGGSRHRKRRLENDDLWRRIADFTDMHQVSCEWIRSHSGHPENEECDRLARQAAEQSLRDCA
jgi:ribonuclease HI